jgi:hypothetical protein
MVIDTPPLMAEGNWRAGLLLDAAASSSQAAKLVAVFWGQRGGPPAWVVPFIGEKAGVTHVPVTYEVDGREHRVRFGDLVDLAVREEGGRGILPDDAEAPRLLFSRSHPPSGSKTIAVAPAVRSRVSAFGIAYGGSGISGFTTPFRWSA